MKKKLYKFDIEDEEVSSQEMNRLSQKNIKRTNRSSDKKTIFLFTVIGIILLIFAFQYFYRGISEPFEFETPEWVKEYLQNPDEKEAETIVELRNSDKDNDGLSDFSEIYEHGTSIFLEDTDSDGYSDYEEIASGNDPLCPSGDECGLLRLITPKTKIADVVREANIDPTVDLQQAILADFREALVAGGIPQEDIDKLTDADLIDLYEAMSEDGDIDDETDVSNITPEEVREFLLSQPGANETEINALTDEELISIGQQLLGS
ncbi:hypothetical protein C0580_02130 [Candidatus Parcubacteria bacterium]|nr:MAG: hypothetical protein C0580_02130 [Candidatus Parcubacteria bacterium]